MTSITGSAGSILPWSTAMYSTQLMVMRCSPAISPGWSAGCFGLPAVTVRFPPRPEVPLTASALLVNGRGQPRIGTEVQRELASADNVDLLCAFVCWAGVRVSMPTSGSISATAR